jgi:hypothetical protein
MHQYKRSLQQEIVIPLVIRYHRLLHFNPTRYILGPHREKLCYSIAGCTCHVGRYPPDTMECIFPFELVDHEHFMLNYESALLQTYDR